MTLTPNLWPAARTGQRWLLGARRRTTTIDNHRMVFWERGRPQPGIPSVVLIHGFASMKENWAFWLQKLPKHWHLLVPDVPGLGESDYQAAASYRYEAQADRFAQWLDGLALNDLHLAGSSMGGAIAALLAHRLATPPRSLTLLNSAGIPEHPDTPADAPFESDRDGLLIPRDWRGVYRMFNSVGSGKPTATGVVMAGILGPDLLRRTESLRHIFADMLADPLAPVRYLGPSTPPMLVQWGDRDVITPTRCVDWFAKATPAARVEVFRGVGHLPMVEVPGKSAGVFRAFVEQHQTPAA
ncbi:alpha/beta fold hydrolase [Marinobacter sp. C2H3]|uniref:alpha/beta fold hydrolase n=1 Tax=Marinobacter sp. C2H3 TaxID=3119003 RepID=UPI00300F68B0